MISSFIQKGFPGGPAIKNPPAKPEMGVRSLGQEDHLEKEMATTPVFSPGKSYGQRSLVGYSPPGRKKSDTNERLHFHFHFP